ncbi:Alkaline phosphatase isozyme conversion protein precursor [Salmonella enterica]|nr:Alkaline phosphatase isozyme conversion protein precursor [Salmonella enterica]
MILLRCYNQTVYPRWRGEHYPHIPAIIFKNGLSPLARGTQSLRGYLAETARFIPAGAGNTSTKNYLLSLLTVYPRWRGEHTKTIYLF